MRTQNASTLQKILQHFEKSFNVSRNASTPQARSQKVLQRLKISFKASNLASTSQKTAQGFRENINCSKNVWYFAFRR